MDHNGRHNGTASVTESVTGLSRDGTEPDKTGSDGAKLTPKQESAIVALMSHPTIEAAAASIKVSSRTLRRWCGQPAFVEAYRTARHDAVAVAIGRLMQIAGAAVAVMLHLMADPSVSAAVRLAAASKVLDLAMKAMELEQIEARLAAVESAVRVFNEGDDDHTLDAL